MVSLVLHIINTTQSFLCRIRLQWRHNERDGVSNNRGQDCLLNLCSGTDHRIDQSSALLAFVRGIHRWPVKSPHKGPVSGRYFHLMTSSWWHMRTWSRCPIPASIYLLSRWDIRGWLPGPSYTRNIYKTRHPDVKMAETHGLCYFITNWIIGQGPLLLSWINFNPSMDK